MNVTMSLSTLTARLSDVEGRDGEMFTAVSLSDTPESKSNEVSFFVTPETAASALAIADAFREAALRHMPPPVARDARDDEHQEAGYTANEEALP